MSIYEEIKKINVPPNDCKGLYLKDSNNIFKVPEISKKELKKSRL